MKTLLRQSDIALILMLLLFKMIWFARENALTMLSKPMLMVSVGSLLVALSLCFLLYGKGRLWTLFFFHTLLSFLIYADAVYFRYFGDFVTTSVLKQAGQTGDIGSSIFALMRPSDWVYGLDVLVFLALVLFFSVRHSFDATPLKERLIFFLIAVITGGALVFFPITEKIDRYGSAFLENMWSHVSAYNTLGHLGFHAFETTTYVKQAWFGKTPLTDKEKDEVAATLSAKEKENPTRFFGKAKGKNVLMVQLESFQNFAIHRSINGTPITPNLNALTEETFYMDHFYHQVGQGRTSDAEFLTNVSLYPLASGSVYVRYPVNHYEALPGLLKEEGYETAAYHAFKETFWNRKTMYQTLGYDDFIGKEDLEAKLSESEQISPFQTIGDESFLKIVSEQKKKETPFYRFAVALSSHHPYTHIPSDANFSVAPFEGTLFGDYINALHYTDKAVGKMVNTLKENGLWEDTIVVLYGDHDSGLTFTEKEATSIGMTTSDMNQMKNIHNVPFFMHVPGVSYPTPPKNGGMIDVTPTLLDLLGLPSSGHLGASLFNERDHLTVFRDGSFLAEGVLYEASRDGSFSADRCQALVIKTCQAFYDEARTSLTTSDAIITRDLLKKRAN